jgi:hypothetical protein
MRKKCFITSYKDLHSHFFHFHLKLTIKFCIHDFRLYLRHFREIKDRHLIDGQDLLQFIPEKKNPTNI